MKLSVILKAYNHEAFVAQAFESALAQRTTFPYEIVVGEDHSSDGTRDIVDQFAGRHPDRIRLVDRPARVGMVRNTMDLYSAAHAEYIAWLDGDDYWTSPDKLQKQVEWLDRHPRHTMCFHEAELLDESGRFSRWSLATPGQEDYSIEDILARPPGYTSTCVFRRVLREFPVWFADLPFSDWPLEVLHAALGPAGWLPDFMAVYRVRDSCARALGYDAAGGMPRAEFWAPLHGQIYGILNRHFEYRYDSLITTELARVSPEGRALRRLGPERSLVARWTWRLLKRRPALARTAVAIGGRLVRPFQGKR
ncbi:MAG TPA: glycosyltransferase [Vicinamibacterales bacterium]|nr:glycosyltransferase [Vicinamibacterales bacterium]